MTRSLQSVGLFLLVCVFSTAGAQTAQDSLQQNISLTWVDGMYPQICWLPPPEKSVQSSKFPICIASEEQDRDHYVKITSKDYCTSNKTIMYGRWVKFFVNTTCQNKGNKSPVISVINPVLVKPWECAIRSSGLTKCSWKPTSDKISNLSFFYILHGANSNGTRKTPIQECPSYTYTNNIKTGCNLPMKTDDSIRILFNGTLGTKQLRNTYRILALNAKLPPLNWTVTKMEKQFNISWIPPVVSGLPTWNFIINYTQCGRKLFKDLTSRETSWILDREPTCRYSISIGAQTSSGRGRTEWSREETFDADSNWSLFAVISIPLVLTIMAILTLVFCRRNKEKIFPKVPVPRDLLSDISENNNKITVGNLYNPVKEEEDCKITLVIDPQINQLDT